MAPVMCEMAGAPKQACRDLKKRGYRSPQLAGVPPIVRLRQPRRGATDCLARFVMYADGTVWSVSPL